MSEDNDNVLNMEKDFQLKTLIDENQRLKNEISKLRIKISEMGGDESIADISDEEVLCVQEIGKLRQMSDTQPLTLDELKAFDILYKNLKVIRGKSVSNNRNNIFKDSSVADLSKLATGED